MIEWEPQEIPPLPSGAIRHRVSLADKKAYLEKMLTDPAVKRLWMFRDAVIRLGTDNHWYFDYIPEAEMELTDEEVDQYFEQQYEELVNMLADEGDPDAIDLREELRLKAICQKRNPNGLVIKAKPKSKGTPCPRCYRGRLKVKRSSWGVFLGCSRYPSCAFTRNV